MTRSRVNADNSSSNTRSFASTTEPSTFVDGSIWVDTDGVAASIQRLRWKKTPSAGTTVFTGNNDDGNFSLVYTPNYEEVFLNGVLLVRGTDYAATSGDSITLVEAAVNGDVLEVFCTPNLAVTDVYTTAQSEARYLSKSLVDAKGDLYVATADNTTTRLGVGSNDQVLVADSTATGGVAWKSNASQQAAGKNLVVNGGMDYWQRNTTFNAVANEGWTADRWFIVTDAVGTCNISRIDISSANSGIGARYAMRSERSAGTNRWVMINLIPGALDYAGKTMTFSGYIRKGPALASDVYVTVGTRPGRYGTQYDGASVNVPVSSLSTTTFTRFSCTFTIGAATTAANADFFEIELSASQAGATGAYYELTGVQLEVGSTASQFTRTGGSLAGEARECQRYYYKQTGGSGYQPMCNGFASGNTNVMGYVSFPVPMRVTPFAIDYSGLQANDSTNFGLVTAVSFNGTEVGTNGATVNFTTTSMTQYRPTKILQNNNAAAYLAFSAEVF